MNAESLARGIYQNPDTHLRDLRGLEYDLLARCTSALRAGSRDGVPFASLARALDMNMRLWTAFAADLADPGNTLPSELRARLFYLYEFTVHHSRLVLDGEAAAEALVEINTSVMRGLRGVAVE